MARKKAVSPTGHLKRKDDAPTEHTSRFICRRCPEEMPQEGREFDSPSGFGAHVREKHPELIADDGTLPGKKQGVSFLDGDFGYINTYEITTVTGEPYAINVCAGPREGGYW